ncbi:YciI family protein [Fulvivirgaceae bacterium BMA12]|uniref:YciI family protein n=1 Tax=Agaribacillus aureus TaxID=3051825 RepID=A0ABT8LBT5_9BACT|nr:YciI family protein [Fulvivirgaceae bacterium BMA12]
MDEFMLLMKGDDSQSASPAEMQKRMGDYMTWIKGMVEKDKFVAGQPLVPAGKHLKDRETVLTDGPFLEPKEIIGGYMIIKAQDLDEATAIAKTCPLLQHCEIFVRPVMNVPAG